MISKPLFKEFFGLLIVVASLDLIALYLNLYWTIRELDSLVHFLGGAWVSLSFIWVYFLSGVFDPQKRDLKHLLLISLLGTIMISVSWEIFELKGGITDLMDPGYDFDTTLDFIMDTLGGVVACLYAYLRTASTSIESNV